MNSMESKNNDVIKQFLIDNNQLNNFKDFTTELKLISLVQKLYHSDVWSETYDWVHDGRFNGIDLPKEVETDLTCYCESLLKLQ